MLILLNFLLILHYYVYNIVFSIFFILIFFFLLHPLNENEKCCLVLFLNILFQVGLGDIAIYHTISIFIMIFIYH